MVVLPTQTDPADAAPLIAAATIFLVEGIAVAALLIGEEAAAVEVDMTTGG